MLHSVSFLTAAIITPRHEVESNYTLLTQTDDFFQGDEMDEDQQQQTPLASDDDDDPETRAVPSATEAAVEVPAPHLPVGMATGCSPASLLLCVANAATQTHTAVRCVVTSASHLTTCDMAVNTTHRATRDVASLAARPVSQDIGIATDMDLPLDGSFAAVVSASGAPRLYSRLHRAIQTDFVGQDLFHKATQCPDQEYTKGKVCVARVMKNSSYQPYYYPTFVAHQPAVYSTATGLMLRSQPASSTTTATAAAATTDETSLQPSKPSSNADREVCLERDAIGMESQHSEEDREKDNTAALSEASLPGSLVAPLTPTAYQMQAGMATLPMGCTAMGVVTPFPSQPQTYMYGSTLYSYPATWRL